MGHIDHPPATMAPTTTQVTPPNCELLDVPPGLDSDYLGIVGHMIVWNGHEFEAVFADSWSRNYESPPYWVHPRVQDYDDSPFGGVTCVVVGAIVAGGWSMCPMGYTLQFPVIVACTLLPSV